MKSLGDGLRKAREAHGVTLDAVARDTRISRRYLDALERGDFETLPGGVFDTGYIRAYASFLGLDPGPFLEAYEVETESRPRPPDDLIGELHRAADRRALPSRGVPRWKLALAAAMGVIVAGAGGWMLLPPNGEVETGAVETRVEPAAAPPEAPPEAPEPEVEKDAPNLAVPAHGVGTDVVERALVGRGDRFPEGTVVWFWTRVVGGEDGDVLRHVWTRDGRTVMVAELRIGGSHWRTYSRLPLPAGSAGSWAVEARSPDGRTLARSEFVCLPASVPSPTS